MPLDVMANYITSCVGQNAPLSMFERNEISKVSEAAQRLVYQSAIDEACALPSDAITAYYIDEQGFFKNILDSEVPMISSKELDGVSDWVEESISRLNELLYAHSDENE